MCVLTLRLVAGEQDERVALKHLYHTRREDGVFMRALLILVAGLLIVPATAQAAVLWDTLQANPAYGVLADEHQPIISEAADDFWFPASTAPAFQLTGARAYFLTSNPNPNWSEFHFELYQTYPVDSNASRTPASVRTNGPADTEFLHRMWSMGDVTPTINSLGTFAVNNTILPGTAHRFGVVAPGITGSLWDITLMLMNPYTLNPASGPSAQQNHYWLSISGEAPNSDIYWITGARPPLSPSGVQDDRQAWITSSAFSPDWRRLSDVINQQDGTLTPGYNLSFQILGNVVPEPGSLLVLGLGGLSMLGLMRRRPRS